jgi:hypothetical protein
VISLENVCRCRCAEVASHLTGSFLTDLAHVDRGCTHDLLMLQAAKPKVQFLLLAALNEALTSLAAPGANPSSLSDEQRDQVPCCCPAAGLLHCKSNETEGHSHRSPETTAHLWHPSLATQDAHLW